MEVDPHFKVKLSQRLQKLRTEKQLTQAELARRCKIPQSVLSLYEKNDSNRLPTLYGIVKLAKVLDVSTDYLLGCSNIKKNELTSQSDDFIKKLSAKDKLILRRIAEGLLITAKANSAK